MKSGIILLHVIGSSTTMALIQEYCLVSIQPDTCLRSAMSRFRAFMKMTERLVSTRLVYNLVVIQIRHWSNHLKFKRNKNVTCNWFYSHGTHSVERPYGPSKYTLIQVYYVLVYNDVIHAMQSKYCLNYLRFDANEWWCLMFCFRCFPCGHTKNTLAITRT